MSRRVSELETEKADLLRSVAQESLDDVYRLNRRLVERARDLRSALNIVLQLGEATEATEALVL